MKKLESSLTNMTVVLTTVAVLTGALLAWVNHITAGPISEQKDKTLKESIKNVMGTDQLTVASTDTVRKEYDGKESTFVVHTINTADGKPLGSAVESSVMGFGGEIGVIVGFDADGQVLGYNILQSSETPGLGQKADKWFQKDGKGNIIGKKLDGAKQLAVTKDGGDVDAITASTITSRAFLKAVNRAFDAYNGEKNTDADATTAASPSYTEDTH